MQPFHDTPPLQLQAASTSLTNRAASLFLVGFTRDSTISPSLISISSDALEEWAEPFLLSFQVAASQLLAKEGWGVPRLLVTNGAEMIAVP